VPHGRIVMDAVRAARRMPGRGRSDIVTIAEAVGSDITSQVSVSLTHGQSVTATLGRLTGGRRWHSPARGLAVGYIWRTWFGPCFGVVS
jgi:hypothetical protein